MSESNDFDANPFAAPETDLLTAQESKRVERIVYARFSTRFIAAFLDVMIFQAFQFLLGFMVGIVFAPTMEGRETRLLLVPLVLVASWLYSALQESSGARATFGKRAMQLQVVNLDGGQISFRQASGRHFCKCISGMLFLIGFLIQPFTVRRQTLHDMISECLVIDVKP